MTYLPEDTECLECCLLSDKMNNGEDAFEAFFYRHFNGTDWAWIVACVTHRRAAHTIVALANINADSLLDALAASGVIELPYMRGTNPITKEPWPPFAQLPPSAQKLHLDVRDLYLPQVAEALRKLKGEE